jgi:hypothetical protein
VEWVEKYVGQWKDHRYTWEPAINVNREYWDSFDADYVPVEKGVYKIQLFCFNAYGLLSHPMTH